MELLSPSLPNIHALVFNTIFKLIAHENRTFKKKNKKQKRNNNTPSFALKSSERYMYLIDNGN